MSDDATTAVEVSILNHFSSVVTYSTDREFPGTGPVTSDVVLSLPDGTTVTARGSELQGSDSFGNPTTGATMYHNVDNKITPESVVIGHLDQPPVPGSIQTGYNFSTLPDYDFYTYQTAEVSNQYLDQVANPGSGVAPRPGINVQGQLTGSELELAQAAADFHAGQYKHPLAALASYLNNNYLDTVHSVADDLSASNLIQGGPIQASQGQARGVLEAGGGALTATAGSLAIDYVLAAELTGLVAGTAVLGGVAVVAAGLGLAGYGIYHMSAPILNGVRNSLNSLTTSDTGDAVHLSEPVRA